jgi:ribonuclease T1
MALVNNIWRTIRHVAVAFLVAGSAAATHPAMAEMATVAAMPQVALSALPAEARHTLALIKRGGPYPFVKDGAVFGNYAQTLPLQPRGFYREFTVVTPGLARRGAQRIVAGGQATMAPQYYYTANHYATFQRIHE